jgi:hypothetical protein
MTLMRFPHSEIHGSKLARQLPVAYRSLLRPSSVSYVKASFMCAWVTFYDEWDASYKGSFSFVIQVQLTSYWFSPTIQTSICIFCRLSFASTTTCIACVVILHLYTSCFSCIQSWFLNYETHSKLTHRKFWLSVEIWVSPENLAACWHDQLAVLKRLVLF